MTTCITSGLPIGWTQFRPLSTYSWELDNLVHLPTVGKGTAQPLAYPAGPEASLDITTTNTTVYMSQGTHIQVPNPTDASQLTDNYLSYMPADMNSNPIALYALRGDIRRDWKQSNTLSIGTEQYNQWTQLDAGNTLTTLDASGGDATYTFTGQVSVQHHILDIIRRDELVADREVASRTYELKDHLANVRAVVSARKGFELGTLSNYAEVVGINDYYPFGMLIGSRSFSSGTYRYGFNGEENDDEIKGIGNQQDYGMRIYDNRLGRFLSVDPLTIKYPMLTPYQFASNRPIDGNDLDGLEYENTKARLKAAIWGYDALKVKLVDDGWGKVQSQLYSFKAMSNIKDFTKLKETFLTSPQTITNNFYATYQPVNQSDKTKLSTGDEIGISIELGEIPVAFEIYVRVMDIQETENSFKMTFATLEGHTDAGYITFSGKIDEKTGELIFTIFNETRENHGTAFVTFTGRSAQQDQWEDVIGNLREFMGIKKEDATMGEVILEYEYDESQPMGKGDLTDIKVEKIDE